MNKTFKITSLVLAISLLLSLGTGVLAAKEPRYLTHSCGGQIISRHFEDIWRETPAYVPCPSGHSHAGIKWEKICDDFYVCQGCGVKVDYITTHNAGYTTTCPLSRSTPQ